MTERNLRYVKEAGARKPHGTRARQRATGCDCLPCRAAASRYETQRVRARREGDWNGIVKAAKARQHILALSRKGVGYKQVAAASGVARTIVFEIRRGKRKNCRARTERLILAVDTSCRGDMALIDAAPTWRLIGLLLRDHYFAKSQLAKALGSRAREPSLQINREKVTARTALRVRLLFEKFDEGRL